MQRAQAVLHILQSAGAASDAIDARARQLGAATRPLASVYAGLALIGSPAESVDLVVIDVDGLGDAEFEFFTLAPRLRPGCTFYAYSASGDQSRVAQACATGTTREFTDDSLTLALRTAATPAARVPHPVTSPRIVPAPATIVLPPADAPPPAEVAFAPSIAPAADINVAPIPVAPPHDPSPPRLRLIDEPAVLELAAAADVDSNLPVDDGPEVDDALADDEDEFVGGNRSDDDMTDHLDGEPGAEVEPRAVRVPWLRYPGSGVRTPPGSTPPGDNGSSPHRRAPIPHEGRTPIPRESLLTEEELAALLEDDDEPRGDAWSADNGARP